MVDCEHTGWSYIGQTSSSANPNRRWRNGKGYLTSDTLFARAIKKYGWENFTHEILEDNLKTLEEANQRERYWIAYYHTWIYDPEAAGYNLTAGGDGSLGYKHSEATKDKIKQRLHEVFPEGKPGTMTGKKHTPETIEKLRQHSFEHPRTYWKGKNRSQETITKIKAWRKTQIIPKESYQKGVLTRLANNTLRNRPVLQIDAQTGYVIQEWKSLSGAALALNLKVGNICKVCQHLRRTTGGWAWAYKDEYEEKNKCN